MKQWIDSLRISLVWTLTDVGGLGAGPVGTRDDYLWTAAVPPDDPARPRLVWPWHQRDFSRFWAYYLGLDYLTVSPARAWNRLVPLRHRHELSPEGANEPRLVLYAWPHAVASVLHIEVETPGRSCDVAVDQAIARATREQYQFVPDPDRDPGLKPLTGNAFEIVRLAAEDWLRHLGGDPRAAVRPDRPFVVSTVLQGSGFAAPSDDAAAWRAAHGLACLNPRWAKLSLHPVEEHHVTARVEPAGLGGVYGVPRGRVIWLPERFHEASPDDESLRWYHRNLTDLTMQVEAHLALVRWAATRLSRGAMSFETTELVRHAAQSLMWLYVGDQRSTYSSASARRQIDDDNAAAVRAVCDHFGVLPPAPPEPLVPLAPPAPPGPPVKPGAPAAAS